MNIWSTYKLLTCYAGPMSMLMMLVNFTSVPWHSQTISHILLRKQAPKGWPNMPSLHLPNHAEEKHPKRFLWPVIHVCQSCAVEPLPFMIFHAILLSYALPHNQMTKQRMRWELIRITPFISIHPSPCWMDSLTKICFRTLQGGLVINNQNPSKTWFHSQLLFWMIFAVDRDTI